VRLKKKEPNLPFIRKRVKLRRGKVFGGKKAKKTAKGKRKGSKSGDALTRQAAYTHLTMESEYGQKGATLSNRGFQGP